jgi:hypothetical protein
VPAAEIKEVFGGFTLIECDGLDDALKWAARVPTALDGKVEVRPLIQVNRESAASGAQGGPDAAGPGAGS